MGNRLGIFYGILVVLLLVAQQPLHHAFPRALHRAHQAGGLVSLQLPVGDAVGATVEGTGHRPVGAVEVVVVLLLAPLQAHDGAAPLALHRAERTCDEAVFLR